ncbi:MAG TPA: polyprenyl synthetase family protein [Candidatus Yaniella excrementavium]|nr:polyprenyl synthetase family protein [Candidatus Yaniella excrementavium]
MWFNNTLYSRMQDLLADYQQRARSIAESAEPLVTSITDLVQGGKRLRALLAWWGWQGAGGDADDPRIIDAGVALELFQAAALIHDDILDRSNTRRGQPSVHKRFQNLHDDNQWVQDGTHFGVSAGILAGDLALGLSEEIFSTTADATAFAVPARDAFHAMRFEVMTGQYLDILAEAHLPDDPEIALERARKILQFKSAHYSAVWPFELGGVLAGADETTLSAYREFSLPLGMAFQLGDDLLGVFGDPELTGKPAGDDLVEGKRTELVAHALISLNSQDAETLNNFLMHPAQSSHSIQHVQELLERSGARATVETEIERLGLETRTALDRLTVSDTVKSGLEDLVSGLIGRQN